MFEEETRVAADALAAHWKDVLDALPCMAFAFSPSGRPAYLNRAVREIVGSGDSAPLEARWRAIVHPEDRAPVERALTAGFELGRPFRMRQRFLRRPGEFATCELTIAPNHDASGGIARWIGTAVALDHRPDAPTLVDVSEQRLRTLLDAIPAIVWTADATGWIDWYNPQWYAYTGQTREEAAGWGWQAAHHPDDFAEVMERWPHSIATGEPFEMEFRLRGRDGAFRWMITRVSPLRDDEGNVVRWYGSNTDIDDQKSAQERSSRVAELLQDALLPATLPAAENFRLDAFYRPAEDDGRVGGDWYDAVRLPDDRIVISIGDVTGHGLKAAAYAARLRQNISFAAFEDPDPVRILSRVNRLVFTRGFDIATAGVAVFDPADMTLTYALAGHPPPIVRDRGGSTRVGAHGGVPLGVLENFKATNHALRLAEDGLFCFYTDGITEQHRNVAATEAVLCEVAARVGPATGHPALDMRDAALGGVVAADDTAIIVLVAGALDLDAAKPPIELRKVWRFHSSHALSARTARHEMVTYLSDLATDRAGVFDAEVVIGEILANTVEHAPGLVEVELDWTRECPRLRSRDVGRTEIRTRPAWPADAFAPGGRGLPLVYALASDVDHKRVRGGGSTISCTLPVRRALQTGPKV